MIYRVIYVLPKNCLREIYMKSDELQSWLRWNWLKERIIHYEKVI